jgi:hypothetical protein
MADTSFLGWKILIGFYSGLVHRKNVFDEWYGSLLPGAKN